MRRVLFTCALFALGCGGPTGAPDADAGVDTGAPDVGPPPPSMPATAPLIRYVDPFLGTGGTGFNDIGSAFPGPQRPFSMIRPGPDTMTESGAPAFLHCSGYANGDLYISAFSHTRMHGTGIADYGHIGLLPVTSMEPSYVRMEEHRTGYSDETAAPGYYAVTLDRDAVRVELTAAERVAMHRYTFAESGEQTVLIDVGHRLAMGLEVVEGSVAIDVAAREVSGYARVTGGYSARFGGVPVYFSARFDRAFVAHGVWEGGAMRASESTATGGVSGAWVSFDPSEGRRVHVELAISFVDLEGARANLAAESTGHDFDVMRADAEAAWEEVLSRVQIEGRDENDFTRFYTALYHTQLMPTLASDVDGRYRGLDDTVHDATHGGAGFRYYTDFSLWDTYRSLHPWITLIAPGVQLDMLRSLSAMARDGGAMPRWPLGTGFTGGMIGEPAAIVIADSMRKGIGDFDVRVAYDAMRRGAFGEASPRFAGRGNASEWQNLGYIPIESAGWSASRTMEFAYADASLAFLAAELGESEDEVSFSASAGNWRNIWDSSRGFFVGRHADGSFVEEYDENRWQPFYAEGTGWQYLWLVPHDIDGLAEILGGRDAARARLTELFDQSERERRGLGPPAWYWHGNEPDMHAAYLFTAWGEPESAARWSRWIARTFYGDGPRGLPGNDDGGTMSAWLVFNMLGLFPIAGSETYFVGSPMLTRAVLRLEGGELVLEAPESSEHDFIVHEVRIDGTPSDDFRIPHAALRAGATITFSM